MNKDKIVDAFIKKHRTAYAAAKNTTISKGMLSLIINRHRKIGAKTARAIAIDLTDDVSEQVKIIGELLK